MLQRCRLETRLCNGPIVQKRGNSFLHKRISYSDRIGVSFAPHLYSIHAVMIFAWIGRWVLKRKNLSEIKFARNSDDNKLHMRVFDNASFYNHLLCYVYIVIISRERNFTFAHYIHVCIE